jgi:hypothetical protein
MLPKKQGGETMHCHPPAQHYVNVFRRVFVALAAGAILLGFAPGLRAATITFAQFQEATNGSNANEFAYLNNGPGTGSTADAELVTDPSRVAGAEIPVVFNYLSFSGAFPADLEGPQNATVTLTSSSTSDVATGFSDSIDDQQIMGNGDMTDVLAITRDNPAAEGSGSRTNLLTMTFTGQLFGEIGALTPQLSGSNANYTVNYSSDFLTFAGSTERDYSITFTSWTTNADDANDGLGLMPSADNYFEAATAAGSASFDSNAVTLAPEAATFASMIGASLPFLARRRRVKLISK